MMNTQAEPGNTIHPLLPTPPIGLSAETLMTLSDPARALYDHIYDYCTYCSDPQYQTLHKFRKKIAALDNSLDRDILVAYFNSDPAIRWPGMPSEPWAYYEKPY